MDMQAVRFAVEGTLRSVNAQVEFLLRQALPERGIRPKSERKPKTTL